MIGAVLRPLRVAVRTVATLPRMVEAVLVLPDILAELERVRADTASLPLIRDHLERVEQNTLAVEQLAEIALPLQGAAMRVGRFADRLPQRRQVPPPAS